MLQIQQLNVENANFYLEIQQLPMLVSKVFQSNSTGGHISNSINAIMKPFLVLSARTSQFFKFVILWQANLIKQDLQAS